MFSARPGPRHYRFISDPPVTVRSANRGERQAAMEGAAAAYLASLHDMVKAYPEQWQIFGDLLKPCWPAGARARMPCC